MQMTNIARDVGEDARAGRVYLPLSWLREAALDPEAWLAQPRFSSELGAVIARLLAEADALYRRADSGIAALPAPYRSAIRAARLLYAEIGDQLLLKGCDSLAARTVVPARRKLALAVQAYAAPVRQHMALLAAPALAETQFLVDAIQTTPAASPSAIESNVVWTLELFSALADRPRRVA